MNNETSTVRGLCEIAFAHLGIKLKWEGEGVNEKGIIDLINEKTTGQSLQLNDSTVLHNGSAAIEMCPQYFSTTEVEVLLGDSSKAQEKLGWTFEYFVEELVRDMVDGDMKEILTLNSSYIRPSY